MFQVSNNMSFILFCLTEYIVIIITKTADDNLEISFQRQNVVTGSSTGENACCRGRPFAEDACENYAIENDG